MLETNNLLIHPQKSVAIMLSDTDTRTPCPGAPGQCVHLQPIKKRPTWVKSEDWALLSPLPLALLLLLVVVLLLLLLLLLLLPSLSMYAVPCRSKGQLRIKVWCALYGIS